MTLDNHSLLIPPIVERSCYVFESRRLHLQTYLTGTNLDGKRWEMWREDIESVLSFSVHQEMQTWYWDSWNLYFGLVRILWATEGRQFKNKMISPNSFGNSWFHQSELISTVSNAPDTSPCRQVQMKNYLHISPLQDYFKPGKPNPWLFEITTASLCSQIPWRTILAEQHFPPDPDVFSA